MARAYENEDGVDIAPLSKLDDFQVAEGYPDIRGWRVESTDGVHVGKVHDLLVDTSSMRTRYLDVRLTSDIAAAPHDRDVLVPIGAAQLDDKVDRVIVPLHAERVGLLPPYDHSALTRAHEYEVRRHFTLGGAVAGAAGVAGAQAFYDHEAFDDRRFFGTRRRAIPPSEAAELRATGAGSTERDMRIPVSPEDTVVLKRGNDGHDEIIIRRPVDGRDRIP
jgi:photosynthetic reaction center H subunit